MIDEDHPRRFLALLLDGLPGWGLITLGGLLLAVSPLADGLSIGGHPGIIVWMQRLGARTESRILLLSESYIPPGEPT